MDSSPCMYWREVSEGKKKDHFASKSLPAKINILIKEIISLQFLLSKQGAKEGTWIYNFFPRLPSTPRKLWSFSFLSFPILHLFPSTLSKYGRLISHSITYKSSLNGTMLIYIINVLSSELLRLQLLILNYKTASCELSFC